MKILLVVGARPNFIKAMPLIRALRKRDGIECILAHTGQHYDYCMSEVFFKGLEIPEPDVNLGMNRVSSYGSLGEMMERFHRYLKDTNPDIVVVFGDVDSTLGCALVARRAHHALAHVEAGERSFDIRMPEEVNRITTDRLSDYCFCSSYHAKDHLVAEGLKGCVVGNIMVDSLLYNLETIKELAIDRGQYALVTMHRQSNVDEKTSLMRALEIIAEVSTMIPMVFPMHPRTALRVEQFGLQAYLDQVEVIQPVGYFEFLSYMLGATMALTDSGGMQVEASVLNVPCLTLRENTEWKDTLVFGTNILTGVNRGRVIPAVSSILAGVVKQSRPYSLWDGNAAERISDILLGEGE